MTNEEAIAILMHSNEYHHAKGELPHSASSVEAFNMAIEALKEMSHLHLICPHCLNDFYYNKITQSFELKEVE